MGLELNMNFLYNKRKDVPLLRGRIYMLNLFIYPFLVYMVYKRNLDITMKLSYACYFIGIYFSGVFSAIYHSSSCTDIQRSVYRRFDYAGISMAIATGIFPCFIYLIKSDIDVIVSILHVIINFSVMFIFLFTNIIIKTKIIRYGIFTLSYTSTYYVTYKAYQRGLYLTIILFFLTHLAYWIGAICWTTEKPNLIPGVFEFHELSHLCYVLATVSGFFLNTVTTKIFI